MGRWSRRLAVPFAEFTGIETGDILDGGCGTGALSAALAERPGIASITGIDLAETYIAAAQAGAANDPRIRFQVGDLCEIPFPDSHFDNSASLLVLHFVPEPVRAAAELRRVTKSGGTIAATVWDVRGGLVFNRIFFDTAATLVPRVMERRKANYTRPMTRPGELAETWRAAGLREIREAMLTIRTDFAGFDDYFAPMLGQTGPLAQIMAELDDAERNRVRDAVREAYLDGEPDGPRSYAATAWAVAGTVP